MTDRCPYCRGTGHQSPDPGGTGAAYACPDCGGKGVVADGEEYHSSWLEMLFSKDDDDCDGPVIGYQLA